MADIGERSDAGRTYPPSPWDLRGQLHLTVWRVRSAALPALPDGVRAVRLNDSVLVGTAWVNYEPGGVLSYRELLATVLVRPGQVSITDIWVDSDASLRGGRELWGIPKDRAAFEVTGSEVTGSEVTGPDRGVTRLAAADPSGSPIAGAEVTPVLALPWRWRARCVVVQELAGALVRTPVRSTARLRLSRAAWSFAPDGPLAWLVGARPLLSVSLVDFRLVFGSTG